MRSVDEHLARVLAATVALPVETVRIEDALARVLAADVLAAVPVPVFRNSAMDGYAVRHADVSGASAEDPIVLDVIADLPAGTSLRPEVGRGEAARIMTGAPFPPGADTVVPVEDTNAGTEKVAIRAAKERGSHVRDAGEDVQPGDLIVQAGTHLGALEVSAIASVGVAEVQVTRTPRVAVLATGSELVPPGAELQHGQIPESNSLLLAGLSMEVGAEVLVRGTVGDAVPELLDAVASLPVVDVLILSGGVSVGAYDVVRSAFEDRDGIDFVSVAMQPGKPQGFGRLEDGPLLFCLPGNPVSAAVSFETFVRPALNRLVGREEPVAEVAVAGRGWRSRIGRQQTVPVSIVVADDGMTVVEPVNSAHGAGSHRSATLARADGWVVVPADVTEVQVGDVLQVRRR